MAARMVVESISKYLLSVERKLLSVIQPKISPQQHFDNLDLAYDVSLVANESDVPVTDVDETKSALASLFDSLIWAAVPKSRRSRERRATRKFGQHKIREFMTPKSNIVACLECGHCHESHSICGHCYDKVRKETEAMRAQMDQNSRLYNIPDTEVIYLYKGEEDDRKKFSGKYIVEMDKPRPEWFPKNLLSKGHGNFK